jgi:hypothetical protein
VGTFGVENPGLGVRSGRSTHVGVRRKHAIDLEDYTLYDAWGRSHRDQAGERGPRRIKNGDSRRILISMTPEALLVLCKGSHAARRRFRMSDHTVVWGGEVDPLPALPRADELSRVLKCRFRLRAVHVGPGQIVPEWRAKCQCRGVSGQRVRRESSPYPLVIRITLFPQAPHCGKLVRHRNGLMYLTTSETVAVIP